MSWTDCPSRSQLQDFSLGKLPDALIERFGSHVESCGECAQTLEQLEASTEKLGDVFAREDAESESSERHDDLLAGLVKQAVHSRRNTDDSLAVEGEATPTLQPGETIGPFNLKQHLGDGAVGTVFLANHMPLQREVVVKFLKPHVLDHQNARKRFDREMEAIGKLDHPNLVKATDAGEIEDVPYIAMEYQEGETVAELIRRESFVDDHQAFDIVRQAALGLSHAHEKGLIHRDIKPSNVLISNEGVVKILDLGLALFVASDNSFASMGNSSKGLSSRVTRKGTAVGTRAYMAPEQWADSHHVDHRADIYSLGCLLHILLTGQHAGQVEVASMPLDPRSQQLRRLDDSHPARPILNKMLALNPENRFDSASEVVAAIDAMDELTVEPATEVEPAHVEEPREKQLRVPRFGKSTKRAVANIGDSKEINERFVVDEAKQSAVSEDSKDQATQTQSGPRVWTLLLIMLVMLGTSLASLILIGIWMESPNREPQTPISERTSNVGDEPNEQSSTESADSSQSSTEQDHPSNSDDPVDTDTDNDRDRSSRTNTASRSLVSPDVLRLSGGSSIRIEGTRDLVNGTEPVTIEFWIRDRGGIFEQTLLTTSYATGRFPTPSFETQPGWRLVSRHMGAFSQMDFYDSNGGMGFAASRMIPIATVMVNEFGDGWHHVALMRDHTGIRVAIDGVVKLQSRMAGGPFRSDDQPLGRDLYIGSPTFTGRPHGLEADLRGLRISRGMRYPNREFSPPLIFEQDDTTECLLEFSAESIDEMKDLTGNGFNGLMRGTRWLPR